MTQSVLFQIIKWFILNFIASTVLVALLRLVSKMTNPENKRGRNYRFPRFIGPYSKGEFVMFLLLSLIFAFYFSIGRIQRFFGIDLHNTTTTVIFLGMIFLLLFIKILIDRKE